MARSKEYETLYSAISGLPEYRGASTQEKLDAMAGLVLQAVDKTHPTLRPIYHPRFTGQIIGWRILNPKEWFARRPDGEVSGPYPTKKRAMRTFRVGSTSRLDTGHYAGEDVEFFTRAKAKDLGVAV